MKFENIYTLYWLNIKQFWKASFYDYEGVHSIFDKKRNELYYKKDRTPEEEIWYRLLQERDQVHFDKKAPFHTEVGPIPFWIIEFILFIPNIILFPFIRTIIDVGTRKQQTQENIKSLCDSLNALLTSNPEDFDTLVEVLSFDEDSNNHIFKSLNSQSLIADLHVARVEEQIKPQILKRLNDNNQLSKQEIDDLFNLNSSNSLYNEYPPSKDHYSPSNEDVERKAMRELFQGTSLLYLIIQSKSDSIVQTHQSERRQKQLSAIVNYLNNLENNGSKLMQYFQVNIINLQKNKSTRESSLKHKAKIECQRLNRISNSRSLDKESAIKKVIDSESLNEKKLMRTLLNYRGFGFFGKMTSSFDNVYCTDLPINTGINNT